MQKFGKIKYLILWMFWKVPEMMQLKNHKNIWLILEGLFGINTDLNKT